MLSARFAAVVLCILAAASTVAADDRGMKLKKEAQTVVGPDADIPTYHALIIGINQYEHWQDLREAHSDAETVATLLKTTYGFDDIVTLYDEAATREAISGALLRFCRKLTSKDALLIFYAGHGHFDKELNRGYWIPTEAREDIDGEPAFSDWFWNTDLKGFIASMKARHVLVLSDSCFSGSLFRGGKVDLSTKENTWYRRAIAQPSRWGVSSGDMEFVPDRSVFARKVINLLKYPQKPVFSVSELSVWLKNEVAAASGSQPIFGPLDDPNSSLNGEFVFLVSENQVSPLPTGTLTVQSPETGIVFLDGEKGYPISTNQTLKWDRIDVGQHSIRVAASGRTWEQLVTIHAGQTNLAVAKFPEHERPRGAEVMSRPHLPSVPTVSAPRPVVWLTPRVGVSAYTGVAGVEVQWKKMAFGAGYSVNGPVVGGIKYYHRPGRTSWFLGVAGGPKQETKDRGKGTLVGALGGCRWKGSSGVEFTTGIGGGAFSEQNTDAAGAVIWDFSVGYSF